MGDKLKGQLCTFCKYNGGWECIKVNSKKKCSQFKINYYILTEEQIEALQSLLLSFLEK